MHIARIRFPKGANATPLLQRLPNNLCQCEHWGTMFKGAMLKGAIRVRYADGTEEVVRAGDVYFWPAGHTVIIEEDYESVEFSPAGPVGEVINHLKGTLGL